MYILTYRYRSEVENRLRRMSDLTIISSTTRDEYLNLINFNEMVPFEIFQFYILYNSTRAFDCNTTT